MEDVDHDDDDDGWYAQRNSVKIESNGKSTKNHQMRINCVGATQTHNARNSHEYAQTCGRWPLSIRGGGGDEHC